jgi:pyruvate/2-oxoglutarate dehydrogenase complex dihydrolipoamide acyltransferase (E2) component
MGIPQITDRMRTAPTEVLRAVFTGIGRILMTADRPESTADSIRDEAADGNGQRRPADRSRRQPPAPAAGSRWRSLDETGNVRLLSPDDLDDDFAASRPAAGPAAPAAATAPAPEAATAPAPVPLPLPGYDELSLASIRARLRGLDVDQLRALLSYEAAHAERPDVLGMLERRIEKLEAGG